MPHLQRLTAAFVVSLAALVPPGASAAWNWTSDTAPFEIDVIFPRNETYKPADNFPIAIAVQNWTAWRAAGNDFTFSWGIMPYSYGWVPGGITWDRGDFLIERVSEENGTAIFVANTNVTDWIFHKRRYDTFRLQWHLEWGFTRDCHYEGSVVVFGGTMFSIETERDVEKSEDGKSIGKEPSVLDVPECPVLGSLVRLENNTDICERVIDMGNYTAGGDPCAVTVDKSLASSISSKAASSATASFLATASTSVPEPTETNAAPFNGPGRTCIILGVISILYGLA